MDEGVGAAGAVAPENEEAHEAWNGVLFDRFGASSATGSSPASGCTATRRCDCIPPRRGRAGARHRLRVRRHDDGDLPTWSAPTGAAHGVDVAERFIETARAEAEEAGIENVSFEVADVQTATFEADFDYAFSRFGTMFFANPVAALRNVRGGLRPGGRLCMVVWRRKLDNEWLHRAELVVEQFVEPSPRRPTSRPAAPGRSRWPTPTPSPSILSTPASRRSPAPLRHRRSSIGRDLDRAVACMMALGPAGEMHPPLRRRRRAHPPAARGRDRRRAVRVRRPTTGCSLRRRPGSSPPARRASGQPPSIWRATRRSKPRSVSSARAIVWICASRPTT